MKWLDQLPTWREEIAAQKKYASIAKQQAFLDVIKKKPGATESWKKRIAADELAVTEAEALYQNEPDSVLKGKAKTNHARAKSILAADRAAFKEAFH